MHLPSSNTELKRFGLNSEDMWIKKHSNHGQNKDINISSFFPTGSRGTEFNSTNKNPSAVAWFAAVIKLMYIQGMSPEQQFVLK